MSFLGNQWIIRYKSFGTIVLYGIFLFFFFSIYFSKISIDKNLSFYSFDFDWVYSSITYVCYNLVAVPACFFAIKNFKTKSDFIWSSIIGGILAVLPMFILYLLLFDETELISNSLPLLSLIEAYLGKPVLLIYYIVLIYTLSETGIGLIHAINDRLEHHISENGNFRFKSNHKALIAISISILSIILAQFGIIDLVGVWYGNAAWGFFFLFVVPLLFISPKLLRWFNNL